jgi:hypothetical protein
MRPKLGGIGGGGTGSPARAAAAKPWDTFSKYRAASPANASVRSARSSLGDLGSSLIEILMGDPETGSWRIRVRQQQDHARQLEKRAQGNEDDRRLHRPEASRSGSAPLLFTRERADS